MKNNKRIAMIAALSIATACVVLARSPHRPDHSEGAVPLILQRLSALFTQFDANSDGTLSKEEVPLPVWDHLTLADQNADSKVTKREVAAVLADRILARIDEKLNGEIPEPMWKHLSVADANGDGEVSKEELMAAIEVRLSKPAGNSRGGRPTAKKLYDQFDADQNGALTQAEVPAPVWEYLSSADVDADGSVSVVEFEHAAGVR